MKKTLFALAAVLFTFTLAAQPLTVGTMPETPGAATIGTGPAVTFFDLSHPATTSGVLTTASLRWRVGAGGPCPNAFKIKVIGNGGNGNFLVLAERGPFASQQGRNVVTLNPPVAVNSGDLIAVTQLQTLSTCGSVLFTSSNLSNRFFEIDKDTGNDSFANGSYGYGETLNLMASGTTDVVTAVCKSFPE